MATPFQKQVKYEIDNSAEIHADKIVMKKDGSIEVKRYYYYTHGSTAEKWAEKVSKVLSVKHIVNSRDDWAVWPKDSYFVAIIKESPNA